MLFDHNILYRVVMESVFGEELSILGTAITRTFRNRTLNNDEKKTHSPANLRNSDNIWIFK